MHERSTRFLLDTNVFIAAAKRGWTKTTELVIRLIDGQEDLIADEALIGEYGRYAADLGDYGHLLLYRLLQKVVILEQSDDEIARCLPFFPESQEADVLHAAACLSAGGILISNDKHFDKIHSAGIIEVWTISEAINRLL
ncbi:PIN domain protein [uncultured archaeon]|nr:PIN domain protein [uncultured archaeon]